MPVLTGGQALVQQLKKEGVDVIFALPGVQLDWLFDALYDEQDAIRIIHTRHEQATSYMADGYARTSGKVGVCVVVPGPGLLNATAGLSTAYACSSPVLCIAGQIDSGMIGKGKGMLHEIKDQLGAVASVTKWAARAERPEDVAKVVRLAFRELTTGRPRPVEIEVSPDVLGATANVRLLEPTAGSAPGPDPEAVAAAARALGEAQKPVIFAGGGVLLGTAWEELQELAELLQAPVVMSSEGRGALSDEHYLAQMPGAGKYLLPEADVVLAVGTRFLQPTTQPWGVKPHQTVIQLDIDPEEVGRNYAPNVRLVADAKVGLAALVQAAGAQGRRRASREDELRAVQEQVRADAYRDEHRAPMAMAVRSAMPEDAILVGEMTQVAYWSRSAFPVYGPRTFITPGYQGTLGYGFATALGAQVAAGDRRVVCISGDGGFMYNVQELSTAVRHKINLVTVVFNDNAYGNVKRIQELSYNGRTIASDLLNPDFMKLAEAFGVAGMRANNPVELEGTLKEALTLDQPVLIEVPVGAMPPLRV